MMNQNGKQEDMLFEEKKKEPEKREAGMGTDGEFSMDALKKWFMRAGGALAVCAAAVVVMAVLMAGKNQKESLIMEVNSDLLMEFSMNRRGSVLKAEGKTARLNEPISMSAFQGKSLGIVVGKIFDKLAENNSLGEDGGILISVRRSGMDSKASAQKIVKEVQKQTQSELQKKESRAAVYVFEAEEDAETKELASEYGISITKASFLKTMFAENPGITRREQEELAGYSSKRLLREMAERGYKISLEPVVVKTTYEKASDETETSPEETTEPETTKAETKPEESGSDAAETTKSDGLSEMQRRRKALEAGESVDWVDQEQPESTEEEDENPGEESETASRERRRTARETTAAAETGVPETAPSEAAVPEETKAPETAAPATAAPETQPAVTETTASAGMLTPETKTPSYRRGPGFENADEPN